MITSIFQNHVLDNKHVMLEHFRYIYFTTKYLRIYNDKRPDFQDKLRNILRELENFSVKQEIKE